MSAPAGQPGRWGCPQASAYLHPEAWKKELLFLTANTESKQGVGWAGFENHLIIGTCSLLGDVTEREDRILTLRDQLTLTWEQQSQESTLMHTAQTERPSSSLAPSLTPLPPYTLPSPLQNPQKRPITVYLPWLVWAVRKNAR